MARGTAISVVAAIAVLAGCTSDPAPTPEPTLAPALEPVALNGPKEGVEQAMLMEALIPRTGPSPDGPQLPGDFGENLVSLDAGRRVVILGEPQPGPDGTWVRVWVVWDPNVGPSDFYAWLPATQKGRATLRKVESATCPAVATIATLVPLQPPDRFRCAGRTRITIDARSWLPNQVPGYDATPAWYGTNSNLGPAVSLFDPGPAGFRPDTLTFPDQAAGSILARIPPGVDPPSKGMLLRVTGQFGDPTADGCTRAPSQPGAGLPAEMPADSVEWCREQFVVSDWAVLLGAEARPIDLAAPQLHRLVIPNQPPGAPMACGGVGMPPLTIRIDPTRADPVWIEVAGGGVSMPVFDRAFQLVLGERPRVVGPNGVFIVDREVLDPDRGKPGLWICPGGEIVTFFAPPAAGVQPDKGVL